MPIEQVATPSIASSSQDASLGRTSFHVDWTLLPLLIVAFSLTFANLSAMLLAAKGDLQAEDIAPGS
eukprot:5094589-Pleurochrysis_carterae.AAC.1